MADLQYNTDTMRQSAAKYCELAAEMDTIKNELNQQIFYLKNLYWKSEAGEAFLKLYEDTWADNIDKYIDVLREMANLVNRAASDYDNVTTKLKTVPQIRT